MISDTIFVSEIQKIELQFTEIDIQAKIKHSLYLGHLRIEEMRAIKSAFSELKTFIFNDS